jgi:regulator of sirC expression with transglutaminase-like and TPR domain
VTPRDDIRDALGRAGSLPDPQFNPAENGLLLAALGRPRAALEPYHRHLDKLAREIAQYVAPGKGTAAQAPIALRAEALKQVLARRYGYSGNVDGRGDPDSINLMHVIDRRAGPSAPLAILYLTMTERLGWAAEAIDFPARVLIRLDYDGARVLLDPFDCGRPITAEELRALLKSVAGNDLEDGFERHRAMSGRRLLLRLQNCIKTRLLQRERIHEALASVEASLLFAPGEAALWREAGLLNARLDNVAAAVNALEEYMRRSDREQADYSTSAMLQQLRSRLG